MIKETNETDAERRLRIENEHLRNRVMDQGVLIEKLRAHISILLKPEPITRPITDTVSNLPNAFL